jgi:hypothetical protein
MDLPSYEMLKKKRQEMAARRVEEDSERIATQKREDERSEHAWARVFAKLKGRKESFEKKHGALASASLTALAQRHLQGLIKLKQDHAIEPALTERTWQRNKDKVFEGFGSRRVALEMELEVGNKQRQSVGAQVQSTLEGTRYVEDYSLEEELSKAFEEVVGISKLVGWFQCRSGTLQSLLDTKSTPPSETFGNICPSTSLKPPSKRQSICAFETLSKSGTGNSPSYSPAKVTQDLYDIPFYIGLEFPNQSEKFHAVEIHPKTGKDSSPSKPLVKQVSSIPNCTKPRLWNPRRATRFDLMYYQCGDMSWESRVSWEEKAAININLRLHTYRKVFVLFGGSGYISKAIPDTILNPAKHHMAYSNAETVRLQLIRHDRPVVKIEFENSAVFAKFWELYKSYVAGDINVQYVVRVLYFFSFLFSIHKNIS